MDNTAESVFGILLLVENPAFKREAPYNIKIAGKAMREWALLALAGAPHIELVYPADGGLSDSALRPDGTPIEGNAAGLDGDGGSAQSEADAYRTGRGAYENGAFVSGLQAIQPAKENVAAFIKPHLKESEYTVVLYSDTPLFQRKTLLEVLKAVKDNRLNVCRLTRGWVFRTSFLRDSDEVIAGQTYYFDEEDFMTVSDFGQAALVGDILRQRILQLHMRNGVQIVDTSGTFIDGDVQIGAGTIIHNGNVLSGRYGRPRDRGHGHQA